MVARAPLTIVVDRMTVDDLDAVHEIERESFTTPWPAHAYRQEIEQNRLAHYLVARYGDRIVGFAGTWLLVDEAHVTTFATRAAWRRQGVGERLLIALLDLASARGANEATLEVRPSNTPARNLYEKFGFKVVGVRPRYYTDDNEDALIMTTDPLDSPSMRERLARLRREVAARPDIEVGDDGLPVLPPGVDRLSGTGAGIGAEPPKPERPLLDRSAQPDRAQPDRAQPDRALPDRALPDRPPRIISPSSVSRSWPGRVPRRSR